MSESPEEGPWGRWEVGSQAVGRHRVVRLVRWVKEAVGQAPRWRCQVLGL